MRKRAWPIALLLLVGGGCSSKSGSNASTPSSPSSTTTAPLPATPVIASVAVNPASIQGGQTVVGTVTLSVAASGTGLVVSLTSSNPSAAAVPSSITIGPGLTAASFTITTQTVSADASVTISASIPGGEARTAALSVMGPLVRLTALETPSQTVGAGQPIQITARLTAPAPVTGTVVTLTSSAQVVPVPPSVTVSSGNTTAVAKLTIQAVSSDSSAVVTGTAGGQSRTLSFSVWPVFLEFTSTPGDFVGAGKSMHLDAGPSSWIFNGNMWDGNNKLQVTMVNASHTNSYNIILAAPNGRPLTAGVYPIARRIPNPGEAQIDIGGDGRGCSQSTGRIEVLEAAYGPGLANMSGSIERFRATFTQTCDVTPPATGGMSGEIRLATIPFNCTINSQC